MRRKLFLLSGFTLCAILALVIVLPVFAAGNSWWRDPVDVRVVAKLSLYKGSYWASILRPGYLKCDSATITVGNQVITGTIKPHWWFFRSCEASFANVPADDYGTLQINYTANGTRSFEKTVYIGKTWWQTWRLPNLTLPWWEE